jgi:hypothetical protein
MAKNYRDVNYFENRPDIVKIFDDLEAFHDFCRFEMCEFNEANLYNRASQIWNNYYHSTRPRKPRGEWNGNREYNRSGNNRSFQR